MCSCFRKQIGNNRVLADTEYGYATFSREAPAELFSHHVVAQPEGLADDELLAARQGGY